jgi:hypothetical protein
MRLWIDTEFKFKGALISIALVAEDGREFYAVLGCENPGPWVAEHVMPILGQEAEPLPVAQSRLQAFLRPYEAIHLVADWPEDIAHFCNFLITGPGFRIDTPPLTLEIRRDLDAVSDIPHNALADARAIRLAHLTPEAAAVSAANT